MEEWEVELPREEEEPWSDILVLSAATQASVGVGTVRAMEACLLPQGSVGHECQGAIYRL